MPHVSVNEIAKRNHEKWLASGDRSGSQFGKPWSQLPAEHRTILSRAARDTIEVIRETVPIPFIDEYSHPTIGDVRWHDPEAQPVPMCVTAQCPIDQDVANPAFRIR
jgi:hypothetical protein